MLLVFSVIILLFSSIALISSSMALTLSDRIYYGVKMQDLSLGGLTKDEAAAKIGAFYHEKLGNSPIIILSHGEQTWEIRAMDIDFTADSAAMAESAYGIGREANLLKRLWARVKSAHQGMEIALVSKYNKEKLKSILSKIAVRTATDMQDAHLEIIEGKVHIVPEKDGRKLNVEEFSKALRQRISAIDLPARVSLPLLTTAPEITADDLKNIDSVLATYRSNFNPHNANRSENIRISANSINYLLIKPGQIVSFNDQVGLRVAEAGFKEAPVIIEGKTVPDIGGGVCQVSSTLYNAVLLANLRPVERTPHFHPLGYVPIGLDATVADNLLDFKFQNTLNGDIYIIAQVVEGSLSISILGPARSLGKEEISVISTVDRVLPQKTVIEYDASLPKGKRVVKDEGLQGYIVSSYRIKSVNGKEISRELLYTDEYSPENKIIAVGK